MPDSKVAQDFVPIKEVRDGVVTLKNGSLRGVLMVSSMNFALKSQDEQQSILLQFQNFLNSLEFSVQIFVQSRKLDIRPYLALLEERYEQQTSDLMRIQTREYIEFIKYFTENAEIMSKNFFVVVPYSPTMLPKKASDSFEKVLGVFRHSKEEGEKKTLAFEEHRSQLEQRIAVVEQGLTRTGVRVAHLGTEEVIELFYKLFNPGELDKPLPYKQARQ